MPSSRNRSLKITTTTSGYPTLLKHIQSELSSLDFFVKRRTTEAYWKIGKFIHEHLLEKKERADYGHFLLERLAQDVDKDATTLARALRFYRTYPILATWQELTWSHYRTLLGVKDANERKRLEKQIISKGWDNRQLSGYLRKQRSAESFKEGPVPQLPFTRGKLYTYSVMEFTHPHSKRTSLALDLGFRMHKLLAKNSHLKKDDCVIMNNPNGKAVFTKTTAKREELFTYRAEVIKIIDGDTLLVEIDTKADMLVGQKLRLRGIDCPEIDTDEGKKAKRFVENRLQECAFIIMKTTKDRSDKYDRYLADIFYLPAGLSADKAGKAGLREETDEYKIAQEGKFLNQELLDERLAVLY